MSERFYYEETQDNGINIIELGYESENDHSKNLLIKLAPENGNNLFYFSIGNNEIIHYDAKYKLASYYTGNPILYPLPNRVANCRYEFNGKKYWQMKNGIPVFLHSLVYDEIWEYKKPVIEENQVSIETFINVTENHPIYEGFPFVHKLVIKYIVTRDKLIFEYSVINKGIEKVPFGISFHTFFNKLSGDNGSMLCVPAKYMMELTDDLLPTGKLLEVKGKEYDLTKPVPVAALNLDNCFTGMEKDKKVVIDYRTIGLKLYMDSSDDFTHMQVYTPKGRNFFCVEKQTCSTDAHNLYAKGYEKEAHLLVVEPGEKHNGYVEFSYDYYINKTREETKWQK